MFRHLIGLFILVSCFTSCSNNEEEKLRQEIDQIADKEEKNPSLEP